MLRCERYVPGQARQAVTSVGVGDKVDVGVFVAVLDGFGVALGLGVVLGLWVGGGVFVGRDGVAVSGESVSTGIASGSIS